MLLIRIALPVFLAYIFSALSTGMFIVFLATEYDPSKFFELGIFSAVGLLDAIGLVYLFFMNKRILGAYKVSEDGMSLDVEKGEKQKLLGVARKANFGHVDVKVEEVSICTRHRVMDLY